MDSPEPFSRDMMMARLRAAEDLGTTAFVETDDLTAMRLHLSDGDGPVGSNESVTVRNVSSTHVVIDARLERSGIVVLADTFDDGWRLTIDGFPAPVLCANLLMRGAAVTAGSHTLEYRYEPTSVRIGGYASMAGLAALAGLAFWVHRRPIAPAVLGVG